VPELPPVGGMIAATLTPFDAGGRLDAGLAREQAAFLVARGIPGLAPIGTTGEFLFLDEGEKRAIMRATVEGAGGRARVIAGIWAADPSGVARLAQAAADAGADAVFLTTPVYYRYEEAAIERWYRHAVAASRLPVFCYHIPAYSGNEIGLALLERLVGEGAVAGIKDSTGSAERLAAELHVCRGRALVFGASDSFAAEARRLGADGFISALANVVPEEFVAIWNGDAAAQARIDRLRAAVKGYGGIAALKYMLSRRGLDLGPSRLPFTVLDATARAAIDGVLDEVGVSSSIR
jgi:4-hydroxy-tetrahydrodipicolinate synthase